MMMIRMMMSPFFVKSSEQETLALCLAETIFSNSNHENSDILQAIVSREITFQFLAFS